MTMRRIIIGFTLIIALIVAGACYEPDERLIITPVTELASVAASWSPDGEVVAFAWFGSPMVRTEGIYLIDTSDWSWREILTGPAGATFGRPAWSPTGEWPAFSINGYIYKMKADGGSLTRLTSSGRSFQCAWSDSDTLIAFAFHEGDSAGTWLMDPDGGNQRPLVWYAGGHIDFATGDSVSYVMYVLTQTDHSHMELINPVDSGIREILRWKRGAPYTFYSDPRISPDGLRITLSIDDHIWTMSTEGTALRRLTADRGYYPDWSPDGRMIIYTEPTEEGGELRIMNADGTDNRVVPGW